VETWVVADKACDSPCKGCARIAVGRPMPCNAFTADGLLLLARGEMLLHQRQLARLMAPDVLFSQQDTPPKVRSTAVRHARSVRLLADTYGRGLLRHPSVPPDQEREDAPVSKAAGSDAEPAPAGPDEPPAHEPPPDPEQPTVPLRKEIVAVRALRHEAVEQVGHMLDQIRSGRSVDLRPAEGLVQKVVDSILRNDRAFASMLQLRHHDNYTFNHSVDCCVLAIMMAKRLGLQKKLRQIGLGALLHDVGKVRLPAQLLQKPGRMTPEDWRLICQHPSLGAHVAARCPGVDDPVMKSISEHHERLDGSGYPHGIGGDAISAFGRLVAIADVYDAMTTDRSYRPAIPAPEALSWIQDQSGRLFDADLVRALGEAVGTHPVGSLVRLKTGELAVVAALNESSPSHPVVLLISDRSAGPLTQPRLLDLAAAGGREAGCDIVSVEDPEVLGVDVHAYLAVAPEGTHEASAASPVPPEVVVAPGRGLDARA
jgi:putative nucleotidyltransferase with HDIG domain